MIEDLATESVQIFEYLYMWEGRGGFGVKKKLIGVGEIGIVWQMKEAEKVLSTREFFYARMPSWVNRRAEHFIREDMEELEIKGGWDVAMVERVGEVFERITGMSLVEGKEKTRVGQSRDGEEEQLVKYGVEVVRLFLDGAARYFGRDGFEMEEYMEWYMETVEEFGLRVSKPLVAAYGVAASRGEDMKEFARLHQMVVRARGRRVGERYAKVLRKFVLLGGDVESLAHEVVDLAGEGEYGKVRVFVKNVNDAASAGMGPERLGELVRQHWDSEAEDMTYWLLQAEVGMFGREGLDYGMGQLKVEAGMVADRYGGKAGMWYVRGVGKALGTERWLNRKLDVVGEGELVAEFRGRFGDLLTRFGPYVATPYALVEYREAEEYARLHGALAGLVEEGGPKLAKWLMWRLPRICGNAARNMAEAVEEVLEL